MASCRQAYALARNVAFVLGAAGGAHLSVAAAIGFRAQCELSRRVPSKVQQAHHHTAEQHHEPSRHQWLSPVIACVHRLHQAAHHHLLVRRRPLGALPGSLRGSMQCLVA